MDTATMRADCARCAALCCVALAFDRSPLFAVTKANGVACPNLDSKHRCRIHAERARRGFSGCVGYECLGAGQRVTQEVFGGRTWRENTSLLGPMTDAFLAMRGVHQLLVLLDAAARMQLSSDERAQLEGYQRSLQPTGGWTQEALAAVQRDDVAAKVGRFLKSLRHHYAATADPRAISQRAAQNTSAPHPPPRA